MQVLLAMRKENERGKLLSIILLCVPELQALFTVLWSTFKPLFMRIGELFLIFKYEGSNQFENHEIIVLTIFVIQILIILLIILSYPLRNFNCVKTIVNSLAVIIASFKYLFLVPILILSFIVIKSQAQPTMLKIISGFNVGLAIFISSIEIYGNWSHRFIQKDYCNKRNGSIIQFVIILIFVTLSVFVDSLYSCLVLILLSMLRIYSLYKNAQYFLIQYLTLSFSFLHIYASVLYLVWSTKQFATLTFQFLCFSLLLGSYIIFKNAPQICYYINIECLFKGYIKLQNGSEDKIDEDLLGIDDGDQAINESINKIVILSRILQSIMNQEKNEIDSCINQQNKFLWQKYDQIITMHKIKCVNVICRCQLKNVDVVRNNRKIFIDIMIKQLSMILNTNNKEQRTKVMNICLYIQIAKKPLKGFYEIIKMQKEKLNIPTVIDLNYLIEETRECFDQIFLKNDVQNQDLPLFKMIQFQELIQSSEIQLKNTIQETINFLDMFTYASIKIQQVEIDSKKLFQKKSKIDKMLQNLVINSHENSQVNFMVIVFYRYIEVYRSRQAQFRMIENEKLMKKRFFQKSEINIFNPQYGVVYIDLIQERGKIKKLTQNICDLFGFNNKEDMISFNINQFMPSIFGRYHARFLSNFIEKGKIKILREKERILFGKNKKKFIFPINARLKTQHLFDNEFGASGLIKKLNTDSDFMIIGKKGKIEEITQNIYRKIFASAFKDEITKVNKLCIFKMIPKLMTFKFSELRQVSNKVFEALCIFPIVDELFLQKFRYVREVNKGSKSVSYSVQSTSFVEEGDKKKNIFFLKQYFNEIFKIFLSQVDILKLTAVKISYKISKLITEEFELLLLQIISVTDLNISNAEIGKEIISQYQIAAEICEVNEQHGLAQKNLNKYMEILCKQNLPVVNPIKNMKDELSIGGGKKNSSKKPHVKSKKILQQGFYESVIFEDNSESNNFFDEPQVQKIDNIRGNSEQSSVIGNAENQSKKQILINAFNSKDIGLPFKILVCLNLTLIIMLIMLGVLCAKSIILSQQSILFMEDNSYLLSLQQVYEYRMALIEMEQFYGDKDKTKIFEKKGELQQKLEELVMTINEKTLSLPQFSEIYERKIQIYDPILQENVNEPLIQLMNSLLYMFQDENELRNRETLRINYEKIHNTFKEYVEQEKQHIIKNNKDHYIEILIYFVIYECFVLGISIVSLPLLINYREKEAFILNLLSYMNVKQLKKAKGKLKKLFDSLKSNKSGGYQFQNELINGVDDDPAQIQNHYNRSIKLITEDNEHILKQTHIYCLLFAFLTLFSLLSFTVFVLESENKSFYVQAIQVNKLSHMFSNKMPVLMNVYLSNLNRIGRHQAIVQFDDALYKEANEQYYEPIELLSTQEYKEIDIFWKQHNRLIDNICDECRDRAVFSDMVLQFKNEFTIWEPNKQNMQEANKTIINDWEEESAIIESLEWVDQIISYTFASQEEFINDSQTHFHNIKTIILIMSGMFIPIYIGLAIFIQFKFIGHLSTILKNAESVYMHFPVSVLIENTYLTSYFNQKIKQSK